jgi:hypothetical protein
MIIQAGQNVGRRDYSSNANFPEEKDQAVVAVLLDAGQQLRENDRDRKAAVDSWHETWIAKNYTPDQISRLQYPPELQALDQKHDSIVEDTISRLRHELGEESFNNLDKWISQRWFGGR